VTEELDLFRDAGAGPTEDPEGDAGADADTPAAGDTSAETRTTDASRRAVPTDGSADAARETTAHGVPVWTVSEVNRAVRELLESALASCWVSGEIGGWTRARSGHCYFTLKDDRAQLRCVMWRSDARQLPIDPDEGMEVRAFGTLTLYEARGAFQLAVRRLEAAGEEGLWKIAFERLRSKLDEEGLLAPERKRPLPPFPGCIGVVTSTSGAALRDILTVLRRRAPWSRVVIRGSRVQGEGAAREIASAIRALDRSGLADVVIVGRGGGSVEDLWAFNEEPVARAIAGCSVPVVSAVGHETDVTIADLVADHRAPTPSAAGEAVVRDAAAIRRTLSALRPRLSASLRGALRWRRDRLAGVRQRVGRALRETLRHRRLRLEDTSRRLERGVQGGIERRRAQLRELAGRVETLSPLSTLRRGYAVPLTGEGRVLRGVDDFTPGMAFELRLADGRVEAQAGATHPDEEPSIAAREEA